MSKITRDDLVEKLRSIQAEVDSTAEVAKPAVFSTGAAVLIGAVGIAYALGQRKTQRRTTVVEVRRA